MTWYCIVFIVLVYLIMGSIATGLFKRINNKYGRSCSDDEYVFMFMLWPLITIAKICIYIINFIGNNNKNNLKN